MAQHVLVTLREAALNAAVACVRCGLEGFEAYTFSTATHVLHRASLLPTEHCAAVGTLVILHHSVRRMLARVNAPGGPAVLSIEDPCYRCPVR
jgi:hypothetical protein